MNQLKSLVRCKHLFLQLLQVLKCLAKYWIEGEAGDNAGLLFRAIEKTQIRRGMVTL